MRWLNWYKRARLIQERDSQCESCGYSDTPIILVPHHIVARSKGGKHNPENLIILCPNCHALEHLKTAKHQTIKSVIETEKRIAHEKRQTKEYKEYMRNYRKSYIRPERRLV